MNYFRKANISHWLFSATPGFAFTTFPETPFGKWSPKIHLKGWAKVTSWLLFIIVPSWIKSAVAVVSSFMLLSYFWWWFWLTCQLQPACHPHHQVSSLFLMCCHNPASLRFIFLGSSLFRYLLMSNFCQADQWLDAAVTYCGVWRI